MNHTQYEQMNHIIDSYFKPEYPEDIYLSHAFCSFFCIKLDADPAIYRLYQYIMGRDPNLRWEHLEYWNDLVLYELLEKSLPWYKRTIMDRSCHIIIDSMIADVSHWKSQVTKERK